MGDAALDPNPPEPCGLTGLPSYSQKAKLGAVLDAAIEAGVPGADDLVMRPCSSCAGLHAVAREPSAVDEAKPKERPACRKRRFKSESEALISKKLLRATDDREKRRENEAYKCPHCRGSWHLTSQA